MSSYVGLTAAELRDIARKHWNNLPELKRIRSVLVGRERAPSIRLLSEIDDRIRRIEPESALVEKALNFGKLEDFERLSGFDLNFALERTDNLKQLACLYLAIEMRIGSDANFDFPKQLMNCKKKILAALNQELVAEIDNSDLEKIKSLEEKLKHKELYIQDILSENEELRKSVQSRGSDEYENLKRDMEIMRSDIDGDELGSAQGKAYAQLGLTPNCDDLVFKLVTDHWISRAESGAGSAGFISSAIDRVLVFRERLKEA